MASELDVSFDSEPDGLSDLSILSYPKTGRKFIKQIAGTSAVRTMNDSLVEFGDWPYTCALRRSAQPPSRTFWPCPGGHWKTASLAGAFECRAAVLGVQQHEKTGSSRRFRLPDSSATRHERSRIIQRAARKSRATGSIFRPTTRNMLRAP